MLLVQALEWVQGWSVNETKQRSTWLQLYILQALEGRREDIFRRDLKRSEDKIIFS